MLCSPIDKRSGSQLARGPRFVVGADVKSGCRRVVVFVNILLVASVIVIFFNFKFLVALVTDGPYRGNQVWRVFLHVFFLASSHYSLSQPPASPF